MSDPVTALGGAADHAGIASISEVPLQGMITLRGDVSSEAVKDAAKAVAQVEMPGRGEAHCENNRGILWMSPDELLVLCPYETALSSLEVMTKKLGKAYALAVNVSDARASFQVSGPFGREVLAKLCPVDLSPQAFKPGMCRRTRLAQVAAAFWMPAPDKFQIICFRSQAQYVFDVLIVAAQPHSEVKCY
ncbi:sarcosine oxidase subunit gamma [Roseobacter sp.]|uniref:sarcosine oxidase subunit gamma n=1 Tax=Roseobacter sp. TaxID=1907202 RepID=UPI0038586329